MDCGRIPWISPGAPFRGDNELQVGPISSVFSPGCIDMAQPLNSICSPNGYWKPFIFLWSFASSSLVIYILALPSRALIPLWDPMSSAINVVATGKGRQHKAKLRGQEQWPLGHGPGPVFLSAHLLLQQFSRTGDGQVTVLVNTAHHFPECRLR